VTGYRYRGRDAQPEPSELAQHVRDELASKQAGGGVVDAEMRASRLVHVSRIHAHPDNIREDVGDLTDMIASVKAHGILQPLLVEVHPDLPGVYQLLAGHRRLAAAKRAKLDQVPVMIRTGTTSAPEELMLVENCQRADLNPMDKAEAMGKLRAKGYTAVRIAQSIGMSDATVGYYLALLDLDVKSQEQIRRGNLSAGDAVAAVRRTRKQARTRAGTPAVGPVWEPDHFTAQHPLARKARAMCEARDHSSRRRVGKLACGQCWETVIREDERVVAHVLRNVS
jgi:ParB family chromosome partitioning protein